MKESRMLQELQVPAYHRLDHLQHLCNHSHTPMASVSPIA